MKNFFLLLFASIVFNLSAHAQYKKYVIQFKDKTGTPYTTANPSAYLSQRAIARRQKQNIPIDSTDLPVNPAYIDSVRLAGDVTILNESKWLNQIGIATTDSAALAKINSFPFVIVSQPVQEPVRLQQVVNNKLNEQLDSAASMTGATGINDYYNYENSYAQIHLHEGEYLHNLGFHGEGMSIALLDAGFYHYQNLSAFDSLRNDNRVMETYNYVRNDTSVNLDHPHGMECLSIMASNVPGQMVGTCPKANYYLYVTEDVTSESPAEEQNWAAAAEHADSAGVDVISTSLGYTQFDNPALSHTYADMNGHTTIAARAAGMAAKKGMIVVIAAGNDGSDAWHYIGTPADADSCLTVGAVDVNGNVGSFSSYGPSSDGRVKPEVASVGVATYICSTSGTFITGNGTSFATPNMAGLVTCLWQAFPEFSNMDIIRAVERSSSIYNSPDDRIGYGIPDFRVAYNDLSEQRALRNINTILGNETFRVYPNPFRDNFTVAIKPARTATGIFHLYDISGRLYLTRQVSLIQGTPQLVQFNNMQPLKSGIYILKFSDGQSKKTIRLVMQ
ncbi:MAG TPA: S8 family serine peptidase [Chitinophagaceae bacterium]|nr:S8 family serine peptidase [Chitinophagaceae bacterium]